MTRLGPAFLRASYRLACALRLEAAWILLFLVSRTALRALILVATLLRWPVAVALDLRRHRPVDLRQLDTLLWVRQLDRRQRRKWERAQKQASQRMRRLAATGLAVGLMAMGTGTSSMPQAPDVFTNQTDTVSADAAANIDHLQDAISALASYLGVGPVFYNVRGPQFNAKGDNATDDAVPIQNAITAAQGTTGVVFFPPAFYKIGAALNVTASSVRLIGAGTRTSLILPLLSFPAATFMLTMGQASGSALSGLGLEHLQFNCSSNTTTPAVYLRNLAFSRFVAYTAQYAGNALKLTAVTDSTFDQGYIALSGTVGSGEGALVLDTTTINGSYSSHLYFRNYDIEVCTGHSIEVLNTTNPIYQILFENLKVELANGGWTTNGTDYPIYLQTGSHIKFTRPLFSSANLTAPNVTVPAQVYIGSSCKDVVFESPWFFNNVGGTQSTCISSAYVRIDTNTDGVRFVNPYFDQAQGNITGAVPYCIDIVSSTTSDIAVIEPRFNNWSFPPPGPGNLGFQSGTVQQVKVRWSRLQASAYQAGAQSMANNAFTKVNFDTKNYDPNGNFDITTNHRYTVPIPGNYLVSAAVAFASSTAISCAIVKNGATFVATGPSSASAPRCAVSRVLALNAGDTIEVQGSQNSGGAINTDAQADRCYLDIRCLD